jgi:glycosyltransferase involved in cell wall biosynthesis
VLRAASLARYFPAEGIRLDVLTARNASAVGTDTALLDEIPKEVNIERTLTLDLPFGIRKRIKKLIAGGQSSKDTVAAATPSGKPSFLKRLLQDALLPDPQVTWLPVLARAARRIVRERKIDLVLITVPPFSSVLLVERLRKEFPPLPIVVDFRDEWLSTAINVSVGFSRSERSRRVARRIEASAVQNATAIVAVTEVAQREIRARYPREPDDKFQFLSNGFDGTRLRRSESSREVRPGDKIVVTYIGTVYPSTEPTTLVEALQSLPPEVKSRFALRFIGHIEEPSYREALLQLGEMVELKGYMPQHEALAAINETDYVLLIQHDPLNVSAKFYDYVGSGKPILGAIHPQGETRHLFEKLRAGWWADSRDVEGIRRLFLDAAARGNMLSAAFQPECGKIAQYERKVLARRYATLLHSIVARQNEANAGSPSSTCTKRTS